MSAWRVARSLDVLLAELNALYPHRDKTSDGSIGDASHAQTNSKHNPGPDGIVEARDFDEGIAAGESPLWPFVNHLLVLARTNAHPAMGPGAHMIYEGRIWSDVRGWVERPYTGVNAHQHHAHVAVADGPGKDSTQSWGLAAALAKRDTVKRPDRWLGLSNPPMQGQDVLNVQNALRVAGNMNLAADGIYGVDTAGLIGLFQQNRSIGERGVGPLTWAALRKVAHA